MQCIVLAAYIVHHTLHHMHSGELSFCDHLAVFSHLLKYIYICVCVCPSVKCRLEGKVSSDNPSYQQHLIFMIRPLCMTHIYVQAPIRRIREILSLCYSSVTPLSWPELWRHFLCIRSRWWVQRTIRNEICTQNCNDLLQINLSGEQDYVK